MCSKNSGTIMDIENFISAFGIFGVIALLLIASLFFRYIPIGLWVTAFFSGVHLKLIRDLVGMRLRKVPPHPIVRGLITAHKAGVEVSPEKLEAHYLAGGNINSVVNALVSADKARIDLSFERATAIDLAGRDVFQAIQVSVTPKVIETPAIAAVAKDGIQLRAIARVTVRANMERFVGGAGEETIIARVGEGIVSTIGSSNSHKEVLENPDKISQVVLAKGLDAGTAFEILSIDIADVDIGENIGAKLQTDQAEADLKIGRARAEERRAAAVALEQEMRAQVAEQQARLVAAEAEVPKAIAAALQSGRLGFMDYYNLKNLQADTKMRDAIGTGSDLSPTTD